MSRSYRKTPIHKRAIRMDRLSKGIKQRAARRYRKHVKGALLAGQEIRIETEINPRVPFEMWKKRFDEQEYPEGMRK